MAAIDHMDKITKNRSSAIVVNYLPWERVFHHVGCDSREKKIANYSLFVSPATQTGKNAGRMTQFAIRIGKNQTRVSKNMEEVSQSPRFPEPPKNRQTWHWEMQIVPSREMGFGK